MRKMLRRKRKKKLVKKKRERKKDGRLQESQVCRPLKFFSYLKALEKNVPGKKKNKTKHNATHLCGFGDGKGVCSFVCVCVCGIFQFVTWKWQRILLINTVIYNDYSNYYYA